MRKLLAWLFKPKVAIPQLVSRGLDRRVVYCANCDGSRLLMVNSFGTLVCEACCSPHWAFRPYLNLTDKRWEEFEQVEELERMYQG